MKDGPRKKSRESAMGRKRVSAAAGAYRAAVAAAGLFSLLALSAHRGPEAPAVPLSTRLTFRAGATSISERESVLLHVRCRGRGTGWLRMTPDDEAMYPSSFSRILQYAPRNQPCDIAMVAGSEYAGVRQRLEIRGIVLPYESYEVMAELNPAPDGIPLPRAEAEADEVAWYPVQEREPVTDFDFVDADMTQEGRVYFLDQESNAVRSYDIRNDAWLETLPTDGHAVRMAVSPDGSQVFVGDFARRIDVFDTASGERRLFQTLVGRVCDMAVFGEYLLVNESGTSEGSISLFRRDTAQMTDRSGMVGCTELSNILYQADRQRAFVFCSHTSENHVVEVDTEQGTIWEDASLSLPDIYDYDLPLRVSADGTDLVLGQGLVFDIENLVVSWQPIHLSTAGAIEIPYRDLLFHGDAVYLIEEAEAGTALHSLSSEYRVTATEHLEGSPERLFLFEEELVVFTRLADRSLVATRVPLF